MALYKIVRMYRNSDVPKRTIKTGLTLEEAQEHCRNPETSSRTCTSAAGKARTRKLGPWFDGYEDEKPKRSRRRSSGRTFTMPCYRCGVPLTPSQGHGKGVGRNWHKLCDACSYEP